MLKWKLSISIFRLIITRPLTNFLRNISAKDPNSQYSQTCIFFKSILLNQIINCFLNDRGRREYLGAFYITFYMHYTITPSTM